LNLRRIFFVLLILVLTSCSSLVKITYENGKYIDKAGGITYLAAGVSYEPVKVGEEYAKYGKTVLYTIGNLNPKEWLTEKYEGIGSIYYSEKLKLPEFGEFEPVKVTICVADVITMGINRVETQAEIDAIVDIYLHGEQTELPIDGLASYHLKCTSDKYPGIYYNLLYVAGRDGRNFIYDRDTKRSVEAGDVLKKYVWNEGDIGES